MIELDHEQLIYLRNTLTWLKQYVPYQERGDMPFHATVWYDYHQDPVSYTHLTLPTIREV